MPKKGRAVRIAVSWATLVAVMGVAGCQSALDTPVVTRLIEPEPQILRAADGPPGADPESCWGRDVTPAQIETVTEHVMIQPAVITDAGQVLEPAVYKTETQQRITRERQEVWFETPCPELLTPELVSSVQRALQARGLYSGAISGEMDRSTRRAIRRYQSGEGLDSSILSLAAARRLGLVAVGREALEDS